MAEQIELPLNGHAPVLTPAYGEPLATIYAGDCLAVMVELEAASIDAIVCDPPYSLGFMSKPWDMQMEHAPWARAALRVLKPGGHLVAFGGTRTFHRLTCALEDAGFEIRDCLIWLYGSGFPKSLDVSKAMDKAAGAEREVIGPSAIHSRGRTTAYPKRPGEKTVEESGRIQPQTAEHAVITAPASAAAKTWDGWGTALKPAWEPVLLARKPLGERTVAANVLRHGTGALNVDGCRIKGGERPLIVSDRRDGNVVYGEGLEGSRAVGMTSLGRWPANVLLDAAAAAQLDAQSGERPAAGEYRARCETPSSFTGARDGFGYGDTGGASRFFYTAKADAEDRDGSTHPTVKPVDLMKWLITLVTPPGGVVLDPFLGSGTTVYAARALGVRSIGIEREAEYVAAAIWRLRQGVLL